MKNWIVITFFGHVSGYAGPLPYDYKECLYRAQEMREELDQKFIEMYVPEGAGTAKWLTRKDMSFDCVRSDTKPIIEKE